MKCPSCGGDGTIAFTYEPPGLPEVQRRRQCRSCRRTWRTAECYVANDPDVPAIVRDIDILLATMIEQMQAIRERVVMGTYNKEESDERVHEGAGDGGLRPPA